MISKIFLYVELFSTAMSKRQMVYFILQISTRVSMTVGLLTEVMVVSLTPLSSKWTDKMASKFEIAMICGHPYWIICRIGWAQASAQRFVGGPSTARSRRTRRPIPIIVNVSGFLLSVSILCRPAHCHRHITWLFFEFKLFYLLADHS